MRVGIVGATGYAGAEVLRLSVTHPEIEIVVVTGDSNAGKLVAEHVPALAAAFGDLRYASTDEVFAHDLDAVFLALPHGHSQHIVPKLLVKGVMVVDLGADFRLRDPQDYLDWYGETHQAPALLGQAVFGLVERHRHELPGARLIAAPGCYPTATSLALGPFLDEGAVNDTGIVVNALSGVSGAGRGASERLHFPRLAGNAEAYGLVSHRHTVEIQREIKAQVLFTPHLVPVARGMLVSAYAPLAAAMTTADALGLLRRVYANDPFVVVTDAPPTLKDPVGSNVCFVSAAVDPRTNWLIAMSSLDNLVKGAAGQAIQAFNVACGFDETLGLPLTGVTP
jgi:N-acetyl-gamma-glutamyl-phosphate reductase